MIGIIPHLLFVKALQLACTCPWSTVICQANELKTILTESLLPDFTLVEQYHKFLMRVKIHNYSE